MTTVQTYLHGRYVDISRDDVVHAAATVATEDRGRGVSGGPHHAAFDAGLVGIEPRTLRFAARDSGPSLAELGVTRIGLDAQGRYPHMPALEWGLGAIPGRVGFGSCQRSVNRTR